MTTQILIGLQIRNTNSTIQPKYSNSIWILNYLSHPGFQSVSNNNIQIVSKLHTYPACQKKTECDRNNPILLCEIRLSRIISTLLHCTKVYCVALCYSLLQCSVYTVHFTVLYCTELYCIVLYCTVYYKGLRPRP